MMDGEVGGALQAFGVVVFAILVVIGALAGWFASLVAGGGRAKFVALGILGAVALPVVLALAGVTVVAAAGVVAITVAALVGAAVLLVLGLVLFR